MLFFQERLAPKYNGLKAESTILNGSLSYGQARFDAQTHIQIPPNIIGMHSH